MSAQTPRPPRFPPLRAAARPLLGCVGAVVLFVLGFLVFYQLRPGPTIRVDAGGAAPEFALETTAGATVRLSELRGRPVLINFWATWCAPCLVELPAFAELSRAHPEITVLGLAVDPSSPRALAAAKEKYGIPYEVLLADGDTVAAYGADVLPTTILLGADGRVAETWVGPVFGWQLSSAIADLGRR